MLQKKRFKLELSNYWMEILRHLHEFIQKPNQYYKETKTSFNFGLR